MVSPIVSILTLMLLGAANILAEEPEVTLAISTNNWKVILRNYGDILARLKEKGYDSDKAKQFGEGAVQAGVKCYDKNLNDHPKKEEIKNIFKAVMVTYPDGDWSTKLVENVKQALEEYDKDPETVVRSMTNVFGSMICWREEMEKNMRAFDNDWYQCINHVYQGLIRGWNGNCVDDPSASFWTQCKPTYMTIDCTTYKTT